MHILIRALLTRRKIIVSLSSTEFTLDLDLVCVGDEISAVVHVPTLLLTMLDEAETGLSTR